MRLVRDCQHVLTRAIRPHGFNVGMNFGRCAGAGLPEHLHLHVVPRWNGDTNYMHVCSDTDVISQGLDELYEQLVVISRDEKLPRGDIMMQDTLCRQRIFQPGSTLSLNTAHPYRSAFERDRDRGDSLLRLSAAGRQKQVFTTGLNDHYRTRLTHSIEVSQTRPHAGPQPGRQRKSDRGDLSGARPGTCARSVTTEKQSSMIWMARTAV
jgi:hypothetical protein